MKSIGNYPNIYQAEIRGTIDENVMSNILDAVIKRIRPKFDKTQCHFYHEHDWRIRVECGGFVLDIGQGFDEIKLSTFKKRARSKEQAGAAAMDIAYVDNHTSFNASRKNQDDTVKQTSGIVKIYVLYDKPSNIDDQDILAEATASAYFKTISSFPNHYILYDKSFQYY